MLEFYIYHISSSLSVIFKITFPFNLYKKCIFHTYTILYQSMNAKICGNIKNLHNEETLA